MMLTTAPLAVPKYSGHGSAGSDRKAELGDQSLDLIIGQFAIEFRHLAFAFFGDLDQLGIAFLGYFGRMKIVGAELLACGRSFAVRSMADLAFRFLQCFRVISHGRTRHHHESQHNQHREKRLHTFLLFVSTPSFTSSSEARG